MNDLILYLLRHGESIANVGRVFSARRIDPPLSEIGIQQITMQAEALKAVKLSAIYTSPLKRALQTAEIVGVKHSPANASPLEIKISDALCEVDVGILDGEDQNDPHNWATYLDVIDKWNQGKTNTGFPGGETLSDVGNRLKTFVDGLTCVEHPVLIVGHCVLFMVFFWLFCENHGARVEDNYMGRGHLSVISRIGDKFRVLKFNISPDKSAQEIPLI